MTSFQTTVTPSRRAAARFVSHVRRALVTALAEQSEPSKISQADIARAIGVHRSVINRELRGRADINVGRIAELAWALGREPVLELRKPKVEKGQNVYYSIPDISVQATATKGFETVDLSDVASSPSRTGIMGTVS